jgi:hypothetical protein
MHPLTKVFIHLLSQASVSQFREKKQELVSPMLREWYDRLLSKPTASASSSLDTDGRIDKVEARAINPSIRSSIS